MPKRTRATYSLEFKQSSAKLAVESDQSISQTANELGINETTLYNWVSKFYPKRNQPAEIKLGLEEELKLLRRENIRLKQERDILKKAAIYFANDEK